MVEVDLTEKDYKTILSWYEIAFAGKERQKSDDLATINKIGVMAKAYVESLEPETKE